MSRSGERSRRHLDQSGATLIDVLLVVGLSLIVIGPLTAWAILAMRQQPVVTGSNLQTASAALLSSYLPKDIAVAGSAAASPADLAADSSFTFADCLFGDGQSDDVLLVLIRGGTDPLTKIVYTEVLDDPGGGAAPTAELWRRTCNADNGQGTTAIRLMEDLEPGSGAHCADGADGVRCRQVELRVRPTDGGGDVVVRGVRRVDSAALSYLISGNRAPNARISSEMLNDARPYQVVFSAGESNDPDGTIECYQWVFTSVAEGRGDPSPVYVTVEVPDPERDPNDGSPCPGRDLPAGVDETPGVPGPSGLPQDRLRVMPTSGVYFIELTVTDDQGASATTYERFEIEPRDPVAEARIASFPEGPGVAGLTVFEFAAAWEEAGAPAGSRHPDGTIVEYRWVVALGADHLFASVREGPQPWYIALPEELASASGNVSVTLTVVDDEGRTNTFESGLTLSTPDPPSRLEVTSWPEGTHPSVVGLRRAGVDGTLDGALVVWDPAPEADRYIVEFDAGCGVTTLRSVEVGPAPSTPLLPSWCGPGSTVSVRVAVELGGALSVWSSLPASVPVPIHRITEPEPSPSTSDLEGQ